MISPAFLMKAHIDDSSFGPQADPCGEWFERAAHGDEATASKLYRHCVPRLQGWLAARIPATQAGGADDPALDELRHNALHRCLFSLSSSQRRLVDLHYNQGRTSQSIANEFGQSRNAVAVGLMRTRHKLRNKLGYLEHEA
jgi:RNA polymerase sigma factor (sigma-70 family)